MARLDLFIIISFTLGLMEMGHSPFLTCIPCPQWGDPATSVDVVSVFCELVADRTWFSVK